MTVGVEINGPAAVVTLSWTSQRNALGPQEAVEVAQAIEHADDRAVSCLVLTGTGAFCSGGDLRKFSAISASRTVEEIEGHVYGDVHSLLRALRDTRIPTVAAVDGPAIGLGMDIALACDTRFVGPGGWMLQGWARAGLIAGTGGVALLHALRPSLLWQLVAEQPRLGPAECERLGLSQPHGAPSAVEAAIDHARALSSIRREVLEAYVDLDRPLRWPSEEHMRRAAHHQARLIGSPEFREFARATLG